MNHQETGVAEESYRRPFERAFLLLVFFLSGCFQDATLNLELTATPGITLPGSAVVVGGITHDSSFVFWDELALYDGNGRTLCKEREILAARSEDSRVHFITASGVIGESVPGSGRCETRYAVLSVELPILAAAWGASGLWALDSALDVLSVSGRSPELLLPVQTSGTLEPGSTPRLSPHSEGLIIFEPTPPFSWTAVSVEGNPFHEVTPETGLSAKEISSWGSVGVFHLPPGYLQIIADRRGDERILIIFDEAGHQVRRNRLAAAWGVLSSNPDGRLLVVRRTDRLEVLRYDWTWREPGP